jgi:hypothetical protein
METYTFYFDESFHDRKIRVDEKGNINILREDALDNYIGVFWGCPSSELQCNKKFIQKFEDRQKVCYGLTAEQELKSTVISKKNFKYGVRSFNKVTMMFYQELFKMLDVVSPVLQVNMISKMELYLRLALKGLHYLGQGELLEKSFYYSLTKFMITYHNEELIKALYNVHDYGSMAEFKKMLQYNFLCIIEATKGIKRKEKEVLAYQNILHVLKNSVIDELPEKEYEFQYFINFEGLCNLLEEKNIDMELVSIVIDEEQKTYAAAQNYSFQEVRCGKSDEIIELRVSDWIASFIGRMVYGLYHDEGIEEDKVTDICKIGENDLKRKRILSQNWFEVDEEQLNLYHLIYDALIIGHTEYWTTMTMSYGDQCSVFYTLIKYFSGYADYEKYSKVKAELHSEYFNSACCEELERSYGEIGMKF